MIDCVSIIFDNLLVNDVAFSTMGVVRREGDWRLLKQGEGEYQITYQKTPQMKVLTSDYRQSGLGSPTFDTVPVREVSTYSEAEGLFEEMAHGGPPGGLGFGNTSFTSSQNADNEDWDLGLDLDTGGNDGLDDVDLPPGGIAVVLVIAGGLLMYTSGFVPSSTVFQIGGIFALGGVAILGWAGILFKTKGWSDASEFLLSVDETTSTKQTSSETEKTPALSEKYKNKLIFDRADQKCEWCDKRFDHPHVHHIVPRREGGPNKPHNLIVLCPNCHAKADRETIPRSKLKAKVRRLPDIEFD